MGKKTKEMNCTTHYKYLSVLCGEDITTVRNLRLAVCRAKICILTQVNVHDVCIY
jgi:hypothetical protein